MSVALTVIITLVSYVVGLVAGSTVLLKILDKMDK